MCMYEDINLQGYLMIGYVMYIQIIFYKQQMGNTVSISPLTITIRNEQQPQQQQYTFHKIANNQTIQLSFPFFLVEELTNFIPAIGYRTETQINHDKDTDMRYKMLYKCSLSGFKNIIIENMAARPDGRIWKKLQQAQNIPIQVLDQIKIGEMHLKLKYIIKQTNPIKRFQQLQSIKLNQNNFQINNKSIQKQDILSSGKSKCRVCFEQSDHSHDPLVSLCRCEGSVKYIHYQCLKQWIRSKIKQYQQPNCTIYQYSSLSCQICKKQLPSHFMRQGRLYSLIQSVPIEAPYAIFQSHQNTHRSSKIVLYRVKLNQGVTISIGRSEQCAIPLKNTTVSRSHCLLFYTHKQLFLKDLKSKYGTYLYSRNAQYNFNADIGLNIKIKRDKIRISREKRFWGTQCCKGLEQMQVKVVEDYDQKVTMETSWDFLDFLE